MKVTAKQYALSLYQMTADLPKKEISQAMKNFFSFLIKNNDLKLADKIIQNYEKYRDEQKGIMPIKITSAGKLIPKARKGLSDVVKNTRSVKTIEVEEVIDASLIGGVILQFGDTLIDSSIRRKIERMREELV